MSEHRVTLTVNGRAVTSTVPAQRLLRDFLRDQLGLTGTKGACEDGMCGSCSVHLDGRVVKSCLLLAAEADGQSVTTIEGLAPAGGLHPVQQALIDNFGFQCGFCTPGFAMTMAALVEEPGAAELDAESAREALVGNICRCTGYVRIVAALLDASRRVREAGAQVPPGPAGRATTGGGDGR
ncbi:MAG TPA: (2Fe-2S)-binding protein [Actinomycetes bacterium]|nr:(2Fe-2S)-binding protein [Actinomycetes bacterium]